MSQPAADLRYPIGRFERPASIAAADRGAMIRNIAALPAKLREATAGLNDSQLDTPYRPDGWTVRQVIHHVADSHINCYVRFKLALTEHEPTIKPYEEGLWAELPEARTAPIELSLALLEALHQRWNLMLAAMSEAEFQRTFRHPDLGLMPLDVTVALYSWHSLHHTAHITTLRSRMGW